MRDFVINAFFQFVYLKSSKGLLFTLHFRSNCMFLCPCHLNLQLHNDYFVENAHYYPWGQWGTCSKTCGTGSRSRSRSCNSTVPLACAHEGPTVETEECYERYCSQGMLKANQDLSSTRFTYN